MTFFHFNKTILTKLYCESQYCFHKLFRRQQIQFVSNISKDKSIYVGHNQGNDNSSTTKSASYLNMWLGNDITGERHLQKLERKMLEEQSSNDFINSRITDNKKNIDVTTVSFTINNFLTPVLSIKFGTNTDDIRKSLAQYRTRISYDYCYLDLSFCPLALSVIQLSELLTAIKTSGLHVIGCVCSDKDSVMMQQRCRDLAGIVNLPFIKVPPHNSNISNSNYNNDTGDSNNSLSQLEGAGSTNSNQEHGATVASRQINTVSSLLSNTSSMIHHGAVRSGQQIFAEGKSLIVLGSVHSGAEVLSDRDIHIYGQLEGRAVAGLSLSGNSNDAKIFATHFNPSLVGIGDVFLSPDDYEDIQILLKKSVYVSLAVTDSSSSSSSSSSSNNSSNNNNNVSDNSNNNHNTNVMVHRDDHGVVMSVAVRVSGNRIFQLNSIA